MGKGSNETPVYMRNMGLRYRATFTADNQVEYEGWALNPKAATSDASWQILKHTYSSGNLTQSDWADGTDDFAKVWDNKATYTY